MWQEQLGAFTEDSLGGVKTWENVNLRHAIHPLGGVRVVDVQVCTSEETGPEDWTFGNW